MEKYKILTGILIKGVPVNPGDVIELRRDDAAILLSYKLIEPQKTEDLAEIQSAQVPQQQEVTQLNKRKGGKKNGKTG